MASKLVLRRPRRGVQDQSGAAVALADVSWVVEKDTRISMMNCVFCRKCPKGVCPTGDSLVLPVLADGGSADKNV
jgi:hypothetical protein